MIATTFTIELDTGRSHPLQAALPQLATDRETTLIVVSGPNDRTAHCRRRTEIPEPERDSPRRLRRSCAAGSFVSGDSATVEPMEITRLQPEGLVVSPAFSHVAVVPAGATTVYLGGQNGVDADGKIVSDDAAEQSARAIDNASTALEAAGASLADVVQWTVFLAEDADLNAAYQAIGPRLAGPGAPPLVTMARVAALGVPGALVEVSAIAAVMPR
jgi:enamine deaminase RidA (YjgF/YER057c/UK114 family)